MSASDSSRNPATRPPLLPRLLIMLAVPKRDRKYIVHDLDEEYAALLNEGRSLREARRWYFKQVRASLMPSLRRVRSEKRGGRGSVWEMVHSIAQDVAYALRTLRQRPGYAAIAVLTLALGIGANTSIFSVVNGVLLQPLPYPEPDRLVNLYQTNAEWMERPNPRFAAMGRRFPVSFPVYRDWLELNRSFQSIGIYRGEQFMIAGGDRAELIRASRVTFGVLETLRIPPFLGRTFTPEDDLVGAEAVTILGRDLWRRLFGGDSSVVGRSIAMGDRRFTVIGVMPPGFQFPGPTTQVWVNFNDFEKQGGRDQQSYTGLARLRPGVSLDMAQREMQAVNDQMVELTAGEHEFGVRVMSRMELVAGNVRPALLVLLGAVGLVLAIACANIANLMLVRAMGRRRELAVRSALGAKRGRLIRQLLIESLVIAVLGGMAGVAVAVATFKPLLALLPDTLPRIDAISIDRYVLLFSAGVSIVTGLLVGTLPALAASRTSIGVVLQDAGRGFAGERQGARTRGTLVVVEVALAFLLLVGAGLLVKSFLRLTSVDRGFDSVNLLTFTVSLPRSRYDGDDRVNAFYIQLDEQLGALPVVLAVAGADNMPFRGGTSSFDVTAERSTGVFETNVENSIVTERYFDVMGIPLLRGRNFAESDRDGPLATIISDAAAQMHWPGEDPIGRRIKTGDPDSDTPWMTVVGIVPNVRSRLHVTPVPKIYRPMSQRVRRGRVMVLKVQGDPTLIAPLAQRAAWNLDKDLAVTSVRTLDDIISISVAMPRFRAMLLSSLAGLALVLALVGIYGVLAYSVAQRTGEIGIRMALGADHRNVVTGVLRHGIGLAALGLLIGLGLAFFAVRVLESFLFEMTAFDPGLFGIAAAVLAATAVLASFIPARRATRVDPATALRSET